MLQDLWSLILYSPSRVFVLEFWVSHHVSSAPETPPMPLIAATQPRPFTSRGRLLELSSPQGHSIDLRNVLTRLALRTAC